MGEHGQQPIKVLNAAWQLSGGGIESSQMEMLRHLDRNQVQMDFLVTSQFEDYHDAELKELGSRIIPGKASFIAGRNLRELGAINDRYGPYDVVHSHSHGPFNGAPLLQAAHKLEIPVRIAHNHTLPPGEISTFERVELAYSRYLTNKHATHGLAVSHSAATALFGPRWEAKPDIQVLPEGCDFTKFDNRPDRTQLRQELSIGADETAIVHLGNFNRALNYDLILGVAWELTKLDYKFRVVLVGDGPQLHHTQAQVAYTGLSDHVLFVDGQADFPGLLPAMDVLLFPSLTADYSSAVVQAQAAGLSCFLSDQIVPEVDIVPELLHRISLDEGPETWAKEIIAHSNPQISQTDALRKCQASNLNIQNYVQQLMRIYAGTLD